MTSGSMVLNGVSEKNLVTILQFKLTHEGQFNFSPQSLQPASGPPNVLYNNAQLNWGNDEQLKLVIQLLTSLSNPSQ
jgi:hypothetical protein